MIFNNVNDDKLDICIGKNVIGQVDYVKLLGMYVDSKLKWKRHINSLRSKLSKIISFFYKLKYKLNSSSKYSKIQRLEKVYMLNYTYIDLHNNLLIMV